MVHEVLVLKKLLFTSLVSTQARIYYLWLFCAAILTGHNDGLAHPSCKDH